MGKRITVTELTVIRQGTSDKGKPWTLRAVQARDAQGHPIDQQLKTFADLPIGQEVEVDVERQEHDKYGVSFMLKPVGRGNGGGRGGGGAGAVELVELRGRIERLESEVRRLSAVLDRREPIDIGPSSPPPPSGPAYTGIPEDDFR